jgi:SAM-dependent methyltransferase
LGHSEREIERLKAQARLVDPITRRFFRAAGIENDMRVLDVGSGAGDVAYLAAELVGTKGSVIGVDREPAAIDAARRRAAGGSPSNVAFQVGDPADLRFETPFDAIVGRFVLQFQADPSAFLRKLTKHLRPGGIVVFHEIDWGGLGSIPAVPAYDRACRWGQETLRLHGTEFRMGAKLHATFVAAGLSPPSMRLEALVGGGPSATAVLQLLAGVVETLIPEMERLGVATAADVGIETLVGRMQKEVEDSHSIVIGHNQMAAWSRTRAE